MHVQIEWIDQLALLWAGKFVWHTDGKHKVHHGGWIITTVGSHTIELSKMKNIAHVYSVQAISVRDGQAA